MKNIITALIFLCIGSLCKGQHTWFVDDTKWVYSISSPQGGVDVMTCTSKDTIINNVSYNVLQRTVYYVRNSELELLDTTFFEDIFLRQDGNAVYRYDQGDRKIYDFDSEIGDTIDYVSFPYLDYPVIDTMGTLIIDNDTLMFQDISLTNVYWPEGEYVIRIVEKLGIINSFFLPEYYFAAGPQDFPIYELICFEDDETMITGYNGYQLECDEMPYTMSGTESVSHAINVYPNPFDEYLYIDVDDSRLQTIKIVTVDGRELQSIEVLDDNNLKINVEHVKPGGFLLLGYDKQEKLLFTRKVIKTYE